MHALLNVAVMAARSAGNLLMRQIPKLDSIRVETKGHNDFVSEADRAAEAAAIEGCRTVTHPQASVRISSAGPDARVSIARASSPSQGSPSKSSDQGSSSSPTASQDSASTRGV